MTETRRDQLLANAVEFDREHPEVWELFEKFTFELIDRGFEHYSARGIWHRIRWETSVPTQDSKSAFKLGNNHTPFYARTFMHIYPEHDGFFRIRKQTSENEDTRKMPELGPQDYPYE